MSLVAPDIAMLLLRGRMPRLAAADTIAGGDPVSEAAEGAEKFTATIIPFPGSPRPEPHERQGPITR